MSFNDSEVMSIPVSDATSVPGLAVASQQVQQVIRSGGKYMSRGVYTTCYCAAYGVTFPVVFLAHLIPGGIPLAAGIADGARAALVYVRGVQLSQERMHRLQSSKDTIVSEI